MNQKYFWRTVLIGLIFLVTSLSAVLGRAFFPGDNLPVGWPMFHRDPQHSGVAPGRGNINATAGPFVRWRYQVAEIPPDSLEASRWTTTFPLGDLDGDGTLEVVVTSPGIPDNQANHLLVLKDTPSQTSPVSRLWIITETVGLDMYSPALADANNDQLLDIIYATGNGRLAAVEGQNGQTIWEYDAGRNTEAGPTVGDLEGNGSEEVILVTDCQPVGTVLCDHPGDQARLIVLPVQAQGTNSPLWSIDYPAKIDSSVPALADIDLHDGENRQAIIAGTWGGELLVAWRQPNGTIISDTFTLAALEEPPEGAIPAIRSSPLVWDFGSGPTVVFGWIPDPENPAIGRISAIRLEADMVHGQEVLFTPLWTEPYDAWKSSVTLLPVTTPPRVVAGYGLAAPPNSQSGPVGGCDQDYLFGGIVALNANGSFAWVDDFGNQAGNIRGSAAVADVDGDDQLEVILPIGCYGKLRAYDGLSGALEWDIQLGPRAQNSPSIGDLDGDGLLEIVVGSYDGAVWVLDGGQRTYLPAVQR